METFIIDTPDEVTTQLDESITADRRRNRRRDRQVLFEILTKIDELQSTVFEISKNTLQYITPSRCCYFGSRTNLKKCLVYVFYFICMYCGLAWEKLAL